MFCIYCLVQSIMINFDSAMSPSHCRRHIHHAPIFSSSLFSFHRPRSGSMLAVIERYIQSFIYSSIRFHPQKLPKSVLLTLESNLRDLGWQRTGISFRNFLAGKRKPIIFNPQHKWSPLNAVELNQVNYEHRLKFSSLIEESRVRSLHVSHVLAAAYWLVAEGRCRVSMIAFLFPHQYLRGL